MENQIEKINDVLIGMIGIGGIPSNEEFYAEFDMRVRKALKISSSRVLCDSVCPNCGEKEDFMIHNTSKEATCGTCFTIWETVA